MNTTSLDIKVNDFLAQKRIAVAGVSHDNSGHPAANLIYRRLKKTRHDVFPVNPTTNRWLRVAWILIVIVDVGFVAWGAMAAASPEHLLGPGGKAILPAGYEGFSALSWPVLAHTSPMTARYMVVLYRMYGIYNVAFGLMASAITVSAFRRGERWAWWALLAGNTITLVSAITYDRTVNAIGPFEMSEYLGLAVVWGALVVTAPFVRHGAIR